MDAIHPTLTGMIGDDWVAAAGVAVMLVGAWARLRTGAAVRWFGPLTILVTGIVTIRGRW